MERTNSVSVRPSQQYDFRGTDFDETDTCPVVLRRDFNRISLTSVKEYGKYG
jgi:hypothetical protein